MTDARRAVAEKLREDERYMRMLAGAAQYDGDREKTARLHRVVDDLYDAQVALLAGEPAPVDYVELLQRAQQHVRDSVLYERFINGTPLSNDIAVWMADFAVAVLRARERNGQR